MAMNPLPPQAFTKETLQRAYQWLLQQNSSIKEIATSQDVLVSLYLKAQRNGEASLETPTIQNFKQELKSLANLMGDLNGQAHATAMQSSNQSPQQNSSQAAIQTQQFNLQEKHPAGATSHATNQLSQSPQTSTHAFFNSGSQRPHNVSHGSAPGSLGDLGLSLDSQSLAAISEVRTNLNLGSDSEALRALVAVGYKHLRRI